METIDPKKAARVWARVQGELPREQTDATIPPEAPPPEQNLAAISAMIAGELADAAAYLQLSRSFTGKDAAALRQLGEEERAHAACLKGICFLIAGASPNTPIPPVSPAPLEASLRRCYGREIKSLARYEARTADPTFGPVFSDLAAQERRHCRILLEIIGRWVKP